MFFIISIRTSQELSHTVHPPMNSGQWLNPFFNAPLVPSEIFDIISHLKCVKSLGPHSISMRIFKLLSPSISPPLYIHKYTSIAAKCLGALSGLFSPSLTDQSSCKILTIHAKIRPILHDDWSIRSGENRRYWSLQTFGGYATYILFNKKQAKGLAALMS